jgi:large subunit ribosomal protein L21
MIRFLVWIDQDDQNYDHHKAGMLSLSDCQGNRFPRFAPQSTHLKISTEEAVCAISAPRQRFLAMYAVIRTGGKQYRVTPGDTLKIETTAHDNGSVEFSDVLAVSGEEGKFEQELGGAKVLASVVGQGRGEKILVFKLKRKKQYKKMQGHRQNYVEVKINEILVNGRSFKQEAKTA